MLSCRYYPRAELVKKPFGLSSLGHCLPLAGLGMIEASAEVPLSRAGHMVAGIFLESARSLERVDY